MFDHRDYVLSVRLSQSMKLALVFILFNVFFFTSCVHVYQGEGVSSIRINFVVSQHLCMSTLFYSSFVFFTRCFP